jgi:hypothetical protein
MDLWWFYFLLGVIVGIIGMLLFIGLGFVLEKKGKLN